MKKNGRTYPSRLSATVHSFVTFNIPQFLKKTTKQIIVSGVKNVKRLFNYDFKQSISFSSRSQMEKWSHRHLLHYCCNNKKIVSMTYLHLFLEALY